MLDKVKSSGFLIFVCKSFKQLNLSSCEFCAKLKAGCMCAYAERHDEK